MRPLTSILLAVLGALVVVSWVLASGSPRPAAAQMAPVVPVPAPVPEVAAIDREVDRLTERLAVVTRAEAPARNPFEFADAARESRAVSDEFPSEPYVTAPHVQWPRLIAILSTGEGGQPLRAVFEDARQLIRIRSAGELMDEVTIDAITPDGVTLSHVSGLSRRLTLD
jgi:hypothetical protein